MEKVLVTGAAGFIGFHLSKRLADDGFDVVGIDNVNDYYDVKLKLDRLKELDGRKNFRFLKLDLADRAEMARLFETGRFDKVVNLAAQAGVRYSLKNPYAYIDSNINGFINILEGCRHSKVSHLVFASSSSVYGANTVLPFSVDQNTDRPISLYAASKKANELMAYSYSSLYNIPSTGLRFFTVYGPWGRPDMAMFIFTKSIREGTPVELFNYGRMRRDFTYIDDIIEGVVRVMARVPAFDPEATLEKPGLEAKRVPYRLYNIGNNNPVELTHFIDVLEKCLGKKALRKYLPLQPGDVLATYADIDDLKNDTGFAPSTPIEEGIKRFVEWYTAYYK